MTKIRGLWKKFGANSDIPNETTRRNDDDQPAHVSLFLALLQRERLPAPTLELRFAPPRRWRFDYAFPDAKLALEVDGGLFSGGAHVRGARILQTHEKLNTAACLHWRIVYCTPKSLCSMQTIAILKTILMEGERDCRQDELGG